MRSSLLRFLVIAMCLAASSFAAPPKTKIFSAGAATSNITPEIGVDIVGGFVPSPSKHVRDDLHARCLVLDDGETRIALVVCDLLGMHRSVSIEARRLIQEKTGIPPECVLISCTHTHSAGSALGERNYESDQELDGYQNFLAKRIADGVQRASNGLRPAELAFGTVDVPEHVFNRRWLMKEGTAPVNPFGKIDIVKMNPPGGSPNLIEPAGPTDPTVSFIAIREASGRMISIFSAYSLHYVGGVGDGHISADYYGMYCEALKNLMKDAEQYPPTPRHFQLGGYETWPGTNQLEPQASEKIIDALLEMSNELKRADQPRVLSQIIFGSCLDLTEHPMLDRTLTLPMDLFLFLGDNIYADTSDMSVMRKKYTELKESHFFTTLSKQTPFMATWDDHDFGPNDGGANYPMRRESQQQFFDWLDEPANSPRRKQEGVYSAECFGPEGKRVQIIMLDTRYFRSPLKKGIHGLVPSGGEYVPNADPTAMMLGEDQWRWLEQQLQEPADLRLIGTSIQFVPSAHGGECWANFPIERQRMLDLIRKTQANGVLFLSGDRHWCEFSRMEGPNGYSLHDFTSSSMTQVHPRGTPTPNDFRFLKKTYHQPNVGHLEIDWNRSDPELTFRILDVAGNSQMKHQFNLSELRTRK